MTRGQLAQCLVAALLGSGITAGAMTAAGGAGSGTTREQGFLGASAETEQLTTDEIYERTAPGVVHISANSVQAGTSPFQVRAGSSVQGVSTGSGFVLDREGHLVTNAHVVSGVTDVQVRFPDLRTVRAQIVGKDEETDLAVLRVDPEGLDLRPLELGDSDLVQPGDRAVAVGNPSGLEATAGTGIVAAANERVETPDGYVMDGVIRTDAAIEPRTSGGPLLGSDGRVIGITSSLGGTEAVGSFAVPVNTAKDVLAQLEENHKLIRPYLGIRGRTIDTARPAPDGDGAQGVLVLDVYPGSPAEAAGLRGEEAGSDVIEAVDDREVETLAEFLGEVGRHEPGDELELQVLRDGSRSEVRVRLAERPATLPAG